MDKTTILSVMAGIAAFGLVMWAVKKLPSGNVVTDTVKKAAEVAKG